MATLRGRLRRLAHSVVAVVAAAVAGAALAVAWWLAGPEGWRQGSAVPWVIDGTLLLALTAGAVVVRRWLDTRLTDAALGRSVERAARLPEGSVRGPLELARVLPPGVSVALAGHAAERALRRLEGEPMPPTAHERFLRRTRRRAWAVVGAFSLMLAGMAAVAPRRAIEAWAGLTRPWAVAAAPVLPPLSVRPGDARVRRGDALEVEVAAGGREEVTLAWQAAGEVARSVVLPVADGVARHRFERVDGALEYEIRAPDGGAAGPFRVEVVDPLFVSELSVEVRFPPHTGLSAQEYRGDVPPLTLPEGTALVVEGRTSRPLSGAALQRREGGGGAALGVEGDRFHGSWVPRSNGVYLWDFRDEEGGAAEVSPEPLAVTLVPDAPPQVSIAFPGRDTLMPVSLRQPVIVEALDDYGLGRLELVAYRVRAAGDSLEPVVLGSELSQTRAALARPLLDASAWGLLPGDAVHYFARASDNRPSPQTSATPVYVLRMPDPSELRRTAEERLEEVARRLEDLAEEAGERADETRNMERQADGARDAEERRAGSGRQEPTFEEREELRKALEGQEDLVADVDSLRAELEALEARMEEAGEADPALRADLEELQRLLEEVAGEEMRDRLDALQQAVEQGESEDAARSLEEMAKEQEEFRRRLEESLERFKRAAVEQDFRATRSEAEELARLEEALSDALEEGDRPELRAQQQKELAERSTALEDTMERLQQRLEELEENDAAREVASARERAREATRRMEEAGRKARAGAEAPEEEARAAAETMKQTAEDLSQAEQQMAQRKAEALQAALRTVAGESLALARRQAELGEAMQASGPEELAAMRADEAALEQGIRNMARGLQAASEGAVEQTQAISAQMARTMESVQRAVRALGGRRGTAPDAAGAARRAVEDLNRLALSALAGAEQMSGGSQQQGGQQDVGEELQQLAQEQGQVNNQASQLMPMQLGEQAMAEQLQQLAERQQDVARDLGDLSEQPGSREQALGDLQAMADEAEQLARLLQQGRMTPDMRQRQEQLFHRLLDAGRSLEREEYSDRRESTRPGDVERTEVEALSPAELGGLAVGMPDAEHLQGLPPAVRQLVIDYFQRLNRSRPVRSGGGGAGQGR